eukprot:Skav223251  [mRNA]  locus=scaffold2231:551146:554915:- [translate_table: standard]
MERPEPGSLTDEPGSPTDEPTPKSKGKSKSPKAKRKSKKKNLEKRGSASSPKEVVEARHSVDDLSRSATRNNFVKLQSFLAKEQESPGWVSRIERIMRSTKYDVSTGFIILADVGLNWMDIDIRASGQETPSWLEVCATVCLAIYTLEMLAIVGLRGRRVLQDRWFVLDLVIVGSGLLQLFLNAIGISVDEVALLRVLRVVRIMRLFRLFRKFRFLKERDRNSVLFMALPWLRTLCWSFLFCFVIMTSWAMLAVEMLSPYMSEMSDMGVWQDRNRNDCKFCQNSLGSVLNANLLIFKTVVAGDSWGDVAVPLIERDPWIATGIFVGSHLTIVFGVLNLVVAVVVDTFAEQRMRDVTTMAMEMDEDAEEDLRDLDRMFLQIDANNDGNLTFDELLEGAMKVREFQNRLRVMDIDQNDLQQLFLMLDHDGGGTIDPDEFKKTLSRWAFDSKTTTRFVRYNLQQLMNDHQTAATKIANMESRLEAAISSTERHVNQVKKIERRKKHRLSGNRKGRDVGYPRVGGDGAHRHS